MYSSEDHQCNPGEITGDVPLILLEQYAVAGKLIINPGAFQMISKYGVPLFLCDVRGW